MAAPLYPPAVPQRAFPSSPVFLASDARRRSSPEMVGQEAGDEGEGGRRRGSEARRCERAGAGEEPKHLIPC